MNVSDDQFDACVDDALASLPDDLVALIDNCVVIVEDEAPDEELFGYYDGIPLTERADYAGVLPDRICIFRGPHLRACDTTTELTREIHVTVVHEIAHYFGIDDDRLAELGYE